MGDPRQAPPSAPSRALWSVIRANREAGRRLHAHLELGDTDTEALEHLLSGGPLGPAELGERLGLRSASATALVDRLEAAGHVERRPHPTDRRRLVVTATDHAGREAGAALAPLVGGLDEVAARFSERERATIVRYLEAAAESLRGYEPPTR